MQSSKCIPGMCPRAEWHSATASHASGYCSSTGTQTVNILCAGARDDDATNLSTTTTTQPEQQQDSQAMLKAKYCPWVAAASRTPKNTQKPMWPWPLTYDRPGHTKFLFSGQKKIEISGHFSGHQSHEKRVFLSFWVHITSERLELRLK